MTLTMTLTFQLSSVRVFCIIQGVCHLVLQFCTASIHNMQKLQKHDRKIGRKQANMAGKCTGIGLSGIVLQFQFPYGRKYAVQSCVHKSLFHLWSSFGPCHEETHLLTKKKKNQFTRLSGFLVTLCHSGTLKGVLE